MSRITRAIAQPLHAAKPDTRRRRPVRARIATTYGKYDTRFTYSSGYQANTVAARNQMLAKLKPRAKTAAASSRRPRRGGRPGHAGARAGARPRRRRRGRGTAKAAAATPPQPAGGARPQPGAAG